MRKINFSAASRKAALLFSVSMSLCVPVLLSQSCRRIGPDDSSGSGTLSIHFDEPSYSRTKVSGERVPDTSEFLLKVAGADGSVIYDGKYGDSPEKIIVKSGTYNISVRSGVFSKPAFAAPLYGDDQCVVVPSDKEVDVHLACEQMNAGIRLKISQNFLKSYPDGVLFVRSADGKLMYGYSEKRVAYFSPGNVSLILNNAGKDRTLFTKYLKAGQILDVSVSAPSAAASSGGTLHITVDTSRTWLKDSFVIGGSSSGGSSGGSSREGAYNVSLAKSELGAEDVWVYGYIVGGDMTSASISFDEPFSSDSNIAIAGRTSVSEKESCLSVQLLKGSIRDALNLVDNPENLKRKVYLKGDIVESYYGIPGIKNITDYFLE